MFSSYPRFHAIWVKGVWVYRCISYVPRPKSCRPRRRIWRMSRDGIASTWTAGSAPSKGCTRKSPGSTFPGQPRPPVGCSAGPGCTSGFLRPDFSPPVSKKEKEIKNQTSQQELCLEDWPHRASRSLIFNRSDGGSSSYPAVSLRLHAVKSRFFCVTRQPRGFFYGKSHALAYSKDHERLNPQPSWTMDTKMEKLWKIMGMSWRQWILLLQYPDTVYLF